MSVEQASESICGSRSGSSDGDGLDGAAEPSGAYEFSFERAEDDQSGEGDDDGELESRQVVLHEHVREQRNEAACDIGGGMVKANGGRGWKQVLRGQVRSAS